jgi:hypothetical protein
MLRSRDDRTALLAILIRSVKRRDLRSQRKRNGSSFRIPSTRFNGDIRLRRARLHFRFKLHATREQRAIVRTRITTYKERPASIRPRPVRRPLHIVLGIGPAVVKPRRECTRRKAERQAEDCRHTTEAPYGSFRGHDIIILRNLSLSHDWHPNSSSATSLAELRAPTHGRKNVGNRLGGECDSPALG